MGQLQESTKLLRQQSNFRNEFFSKLLTMLNIEANLMGCVFLASLYPCFREDHLKNFDTKISEMQISGDFVRMVTSRGAVWRRNTFGDS